MRRPSWIICLLLSAAPAAVKASDDHGLRILPASPTVELPFLVVVEDAWPTNCAGAVSLTVEADTIELVATPAEESPGETCAPTPLPFARVVNPGADAPDVAFAEAVQVRYLFATDAGLELRAEQEFRFTHEAPEQFPPIATGSRVSNQLESSGLFLEQQGQTLTALLADYAEDGSAVWYYAAGPLVGLAFTAPLQRLAAADCPAPPCARAMPVDVGRVDLAFVDVGSLDGGRVLASFADVALAGQAETGDAFDYRRFRFHRDPSLSGLDPALPDLNGRWIAVARRLDGLLENAASLEITYERIDVVNGETTYVYSGRVVGTRIPMEPVEIACVLGSAAPGEPDYCEVRGSLDIAAATCRSIRWDVVDITYDRAAGFANCAITNFAIDSTLDLVRAPW
ncbi:MAG: hypothetical protein AAGE01_02810 [Pseudomonadota bacterium]